MAYDTGSTVLTIFEDEVPLFYGAPVNSLNLPRRLFDSVGPRVLRSVFPMQMRIITSDHHEIMLDWRRVQACVLPKLHGVPRLSPKDLELELYTCTTPRTNTLYVAINQTELIQLLPDV
jgi:hypothetical protein